MIKKIIPISIKKKIKWYLWKDKHILNKNIELKDKGKGKRAFLLATGPSIKSENLKILEGEDCYSISNFFLHEDINRIKPKFHFFAPYHEPLILENYIQWLRNADNTLPKETKIFLGHTGCELVKKYNLFVNREVFYMYLDDSIEYKNIDLLKSVPAPQTGPLMIFNLLLYMNYDEIYLLGCDHNTLKDYGKTIENFYSKDKDIRKNATSGSAWGNIINELEANLKIFKSYEKIKRNHKKMKIYNLSSESWIDCFEKKSFLETVNKGG